MCTLSPLSPEASILWNSGTISQSAYWRWSSWDRECFHHHRKPSHCFWTVILPSCPYPLLDSCTANMLSFYIFCHFLSSHRVYKLLGYFLSFGTPICWIYTCDWNSQLLQVLTRVSKVGVLIYIAISSVWECQFPQLLTNTWYCQSFKVKP